MILRPITSLIKFNQFKTKKPFFESFKFIAWYLFKILFFNTPIPWPYILKIKLLKIFGAKIGKKLIIKPRVNIHFPWNLKIGDNTVIGWGVKLYCLGKIKIGNNVVISQGAHLCAGSHKFEDQSFELLKSDIIISDNSWLAAECFVGNGVHVGEKSIIGARSVVFSDVLPNEVVVGNPAKKIKNL